MAEERQRMGIEIANWMHTYRDGFYGIVQHPDGREGFVSKDGGAFSFYAIGEGQDPIEVQGFARELHDLLGSTTIDAKRLMQLGDKLRELAKPKSTEGGQP